MSKLNILVVEDEFLVAADIEESLISLGYNVQNTLPSGQAAIDEVEKKLPDLILMDISLKGDMTGIEAATIIRQKHDVPVIFLTANADLPTIEKAKISLPYGYIIKPFSEKELQTNIEIARYKFENDIQSKIESDQFNTFFKSNQKVKSQIILTGEKGLEKINLPNVYFAEQSGLQTKIHLRDEVITIIEPLEEVEKKLPENAFVRVSSDYIINLDKVFIAKYPELIMADTMTVITVDEEHKNLLEAMLGK
ncbi:MAG: response regulator [Bacteroidales bacterium]|nr:response regulator [Bacteroidales bacterium]